MKPLLKYPGGKQRELRRLLPYVPNHFHRYIEPFLGGGAMYFHLEPKNAVLTDVVPSLIDFYEAVRDNYAELKSQLNDIQQVWADNRALYEQARLNAESPSVRVENHNEALYYYMRDILNGKTTDSGILPAVAYFFINKLAYAGQIRYNSTGQFNVPFGHYASFTANVITEEASKLLKSAQLLARTDYHRALELAQPDDFIFLDPPYDSTFRSFKAGTPFTEEDQIELARAYKQLPCKALMVINKTSITSELYKGYIADEYAYTYNTNIKNRYSRISDHMIVINYPKPC